MDHVPKSTSAFLCGVKGHTWNYCAEEGEPGDEATISLSSPEFEGFGTSLSQGISIKTPLDWPSDCSSDEFCNVAQILLKGRKLSLERKIIANAQSFRLTAAIGNLELYGSVVLLHAGLQFELGTNSTVGIVGSIELSNPPITMNGSCKINKGGSEA